MSSPSGPSGPSGPAEAQKMQLMQKMYPIIDMWLNRQTHAAIAFLVVGSFFVALRFLTRQFNDKSRFGWDDWMIIPALLAFIACCVAGLTHAHYMHAAVNDMWTAMNLQLNGPPPHTTKAQFMSQMQSLMIDSANDKVSYQKAGYAINVSFPLSTMFPKLSIALTYYLRIFTSLNHGARYISLGLLVFLTLNGIAFLIPSIAQCNPIHAIWSDPPQFDKCIDRHRFGTWINLPHIVSDVIMLALPLPLVWRLKFPAAKKIGLSFIFLSGGLGLVGSCIRFAMNIHNFYVRHMNNNSMSDEAIRLSVLTTIFTIMEPCMYVIAACLPPILGLVSQKGPGWVSSASSRLARSTGYGSSQGTSSNPSGAASQGSKTALGGNSSAGFGGSAAGRDTKLISAIDEEDESRLGTPTMGWNEKGGGYKEVTVSVRNEGLPVKETV